MMIAPGFKPGKVGAREQQHAAGDDSRADEHLGGAAQQGGVGKRHDHDRPECKSRQWRQK